MPTGTQTTSNVFTQFDSPVAQATNAINEGDNWLVISRNRSTGRIEVRGSQGQEGAESLYREVETTFYNTREQKPGY